MMHAGYPAHLEDLHHERGIALLVRTVLQDALHDTTTKRVLAQGDQVTTERVQQTSDVLRGHTLYDLLDDVVAILVTDTPHQCPIQLSNHADLLLQGQHFQGFLNDTAAVQLQRQGQHLVQQHVKDAVDRHIVGIDAAHQQIVHIASC